MFILAATVFLCELRRRRRGRFFQYTLREMFLVVTLAACLSSWWAVHHNLRRQELAIVAQLAKSADKLFVSPTYRGPVFLRKLLKGSWLNDFLVIRHFAYAGAERDGKLSDEDCQAIAELVHLKLLHVGYCRISPLQLSKIAALSNLELLSLDPTNPLTADDVRRLLTLKKLHTLSLVDVLVKGEAIAVLSECGSLRSTRPTRHSARRQRHRATGQAAAVEQFGCETHANHSRWP